MSPTIAIPAEPLLVQGVAGMATLWLALSGWVVADRVAYDRHRRRLETVEHALTDPSLETLTPMARAAYVREMLDKLPALMVYRLAGRAELPAWVRELCGKHAVEHIGLERILDDAAPHRGARRKWRRISALHALAHARPTAIHALLRAALGDADVDVAGAAATVLQRLGDRRAAEILVEGLRSARLPLSRIVARLDKFTIPLDDLVRPLLTSTRPEARYWAATLLRKYHDHGGLGAAIEPLVDDADAPVRKAALLTLAAIGADSTARLATWRLTDPAPFVRSAAILALAQVGERSPDRARRQAIAAAIAPALADREWGVRTAAKDALAKLGPATWRAVAAQLSSSDRFARNGAAEVLQNLGVLDWTLRGIASGVRPSDEAVDVLKRALEEGGLAMAEAAMLRTKAEPIPAVHALLASLRVQEVAS